MDPEVAPLPPLTSRQVELLELVRRATAVNWSPLGLHESEVLAMVTADDIDRARLLQVVGP